MMRSFAEDILERRRLNVEAAVLEVAAGSGALTQLLAGRAKSVLATDTTRGISRASMSWYRGRVILRPAGRFAQNWKPCMRPLGSPFGIS